GPRPRCSSPGCSCSAASATRPSACSRRSWATSRPRGSRRACASRTPAKQPLATLRSPCQRPSRRSTRATWSAASNSCSKRSRVPTAARTTSARSWSPSSTSSASSTRWRARPAGASPRPCTSGPVRKSDAEPTDSRTGPLVAEVAAIALGAKQGALPAPVERVRAYAGRGLEGEYHLAPQRAESGAAITLIAEEALAGLRDDTGIALSHAESRRNVLTRGVDLNALVGRRFRVGDVECEGVELCEPCLGLARLV